MDSNVSFPEGWTAPTELTGALPRKTRMARGGKQMAVGGTLFLLCGSAVLLFCFREPAQEMARTAALRRGSSETTGVVTRQWSKGRSGEMVSYTFTASGVAFTGECSVPIGHLAGLREADPLPIRFLSSNPAMNHPAGWEGPDPDWWVPCVFSAVFPACGIVLIIGLRRDRQLLAEGVPTAGVVTKRSRGSRGGYAMEYQFRTEDGRVAEGSGGCWNRPEIGSTVCVLYLPQNPRRNKAYSELTYRVAQ
jgi:hypothetical protein